MLDPYLRVLIDPPLNSAGKYLANWGISSNLLTLSGFAAGLLAMGAITHHFYITAAILLILNRILDGLDGAVARHTRPTDFGGMLDIVCDFIVYSGIVFAFGLADPENLLYSAFLIFSFIGPITTFLAYAIVASKYNANTTRRGIKSFYHLGGICEGTETAFALLLICVFPETFAWVCLIYGTLCWITTLGRLYRAYIDFPQSEPLPTKDSLVQNRQ